MNPIAILNPCSLRNVSKYGDGTGLAGGELFSGGDEMDRGLGVGQAGLPLNLWFYRILHRVPAWGKGKDRADVANLSPPEVVIERAALGGSKVRIWAIGNGFWPVGHLA